jgi:hypothetical protein
MIKILAALSLYTVIPHEIPTVRKTAKLCPEPQQHKVKYALISASFSEHLFPLVKSEGLAKSNNLSYVLLYLQFVGILYNSIFNMF